MVPILQCINRVYSSAVASKAEMLIVIHLFAGKEAKLIDLLKRVITPKWYLLGLELTDDEEAMNIIDDDHKNDAEAGLKATFKLWKKKCENPTWDKVVAALRNIGENNLAAKLEKDFCT